MAFVGFLNPYIASLVDEEKKIYKDLFMCGEAMRVNVTPNYNEAKLYCNNRMKEYVKEFKDGSITLGTDHLPVEASKVCFGHDVIDNDSEIVYKTNDMANYVGVGFFADEMLNGRKRYVATVLYKVKFGEAADEYSTKGENIEFKTPSIDGVIAGIKTMSGKELKYLIQKLMLISGCVAFWEAVLRMERLRQQRTKLYKLTNRKTEWQEAKICTDIWNMSRLEGKNIPLSAT